MGWDWTEDFESGNLDWWDGKFESDANDTFVVQDTVVAFGEYAGDAFTFGVADEAYCYKLWGTGYQMINYRAEVRFQALPGNGLKLGVMEVRDGGGALIANVHVENVGGVYFANVYNAVEDDTYGDTFAFNANVWYTFLIHITRGNTTGAMYLEIDGNEVFNRLLIDTQTAFLYNEIRLGIVGSAFNTMSTARIYVDRVAVDNIKTDQPSTTTTSTSTTTSSTSTTISTTTSTSTSTTSVGTSTTLSTSTSTTSTAPGSSSTSTTLSTSTSTSTTVPPGLWCNGFDDGTVDAWSGVTVPPPTIQSGMKYQGAYGAECEYGEYLRKNVYQDISKYMRHYVRFNLLTGNNLDKIILGYFYADEDGDYRVVLYYGLQNLNGTWYWWIRYRDSGAYVDDWSAHPVAKDTWYCLRVYHKQGTSGRGAATVRIDDVETIGDGGVSNGNSGKTFIIRTGWMSSSYNNVDARVFVDEYCINEGTIDCMTTTTSTSTTSTTSTTLSTSTSTSTTSTSTSTTSTSSTSTSTTMWRTPDGGPAAWIWDEPNCGVADVMEGDPSSWIWKVLAAGDNDIPKGDPTSWTWTTFTCETTSTSTSTTAPI